MANRTEQIVKSFLTYNTKSDPSNTDQRFLVSGSKNTLISDADKILARQGFTLQSVAGTTGNPIAGSTEWENSTGSELVLRAHDAVLEVYINSAYETLMESLTSVALIFDTFWNDTEKIDELIWTDGSSNLYTWSGGIATLSSITAATVTLQGSSTFGQLRFLSTGTRAIRIKDDNGTWHRTVYTGGEGTVTLTGLATDLTSFPFTGGNLIVQEVVTNSTTPASGFNADFVVVVDNQAWIGSRTSNVIYVSKNTNVLDYTFSTPRAVGEGAKLTLDGPGRAIGVVKGDVVIHAGTDFLYSSVFNQITVGATLAETLKVVRLKTTSRQAALHQNLLCKIGNGIVWVAADNQMYQLDDASLSFNPDLINLSDPVKPDFIAANFSGGHLKFDKTRVYISAPLSATNFIYEFRLISSDGSQGTGGYQRQYFWQPPQSFPIQRWATIGGLIHGHSSATNETYKLFDGFNDNRQAIHSIALLAKWDGGSRMLLKDGTEMFNEGGITANTTISVSYLFEKDGGDTELVTKQIVGSFADILYSLSQDPSLGNNPLGDISLSGDVLTTLDLPHFRIIHDINPQEFFNYDVKFETNDVDAQWSWMAHGNDATISTGKATAIKN